MSFDREVDELIQRYIYDTEGRELSLEEISQRPRWKRVWVYWKALEKYEGKQKSNISLEEAKQIYGD